MPYLSPSRRTFLGMLPAAALSSRISFAQTPQTSVATRVLLGTSGKVSKGIYTAFWNASTGELGAITLAANVASPTFLAIRRSGSRTFVYAVSEVDGTDACVTAFEETSASASEPLQLRKINAMPTNGGGPTHLSVSPDGHTLAVANYGGGSTTTYRLAEDGSISTAVSHFQYNGHGADPERQKSPHAHSAAFSPDGRFLLVNDLGLDRINVYSVDGTTSAIKPNTSPFWSARPRTGPRHIAFHPNGKRLYSVNELDSTVDILHWHAQSGRIEAIGHVSTLEKGFPPNTAFAGEILLSPDGRHLYVGNRIAAETIALLQVSSDGSSLHLDQLASNGGKLNRHMALDPTGRWMVLSDQGSGTVVVLERDSATGHLSEPKHSYPLDTVMFATFL